MKKSYISLLFILCLGIVALAQDTRLKIIEQPRPELPVKHGTLDIQGTVVLRVQFLEFGEIGEILTVKELPAGLTQNAINAARKIRFEPEKKDGKTVTVYREIQYSYSWNGGWLDAPNKTSDASPTAGDPAKATAIVAKAIQNLGGDRYLQIKRRSVKANSAYCTTARSLRFRHFWT